MTACVEYCYVIMFGVIEELSLSNGSTTNMFLMFTTFCYLILLQEDSKKNTPKKLTALERTAAEGEALLKVITLLRLPLQ